MAVELVKDEFECTVLEVKVIEVKGKSVKLGFEFPPTSTVLRKEIHDRIVQENLAATQAHSDDLDLMGAMSGLGDLGGQKGEASDKKTPSGDADT